MTTASDPDDGMFGEKYNEMFRLFGGDATATRATCALRREGVSSMAVLADMAKELGERELFRRLRKIRSVGKLCQERIDRGLTEYRSDRTGGSAE